MSFILIIAGCGAKLEARVATVELELDKFTKIADTLVTWKTSIQAETINYGGGGWVVLGTSIVIIIFLAAFGLLIKALLSKINLLKLVTSAISQVPPEVGRMIKDKIEYEVKMGELSGGPFKKKQKHALEGFTKKYGTFAKDP